MEGLDLVGMKFDYVLGDYRIEAVVEMYDPDIGITAVDNDTGKKEITFCFYGHSFAKYNEQDEIDKKIDDLSIPLVIKGILAGEVLASDLAVIRNEANGREMKGNNPPGSMCAFS